MEKLAFTKACLSDVSAIMVIMHAPLVKFLCQAAMGCIPALEYLLPCTSGACGHVLSSYQTVNGTASQDPDVW
jgi:hypothetical protein